MDILLDIIVKDMKLSTDVKNIHMQGNMSQICYLSLSFYFILKNG